MSAMTLTRKQAAEACNVSLPVLDGFLHRQYDPLPHIRIGRKYVILADELPAWLKAEFERQHNGRAI